MSRRALRGLVTLMFALLVTAFFLILIGGFDLDGSGPDGRDAHLAKESAFEFDEVALGETKLRRYQSKRVWVSRLSDRQKTQLENLNPFLLEPNTGCSPQATLCVVLAAAQTQGFDLSYTKAPPPQLPSEVPWIGGFVDPTNGVVYDLLGRVFNIAAFSKAPDQRLDNQHQAALQVLNGSTEN